MSKSTFHGTARRQRIVRGVTPLVILLFVVLLIIGHAAETGRPISSFTIFNIFQNSATLGLLALAIGLTVIVGEFDLSSIAMFTLGGILAVKFGETHPLAGVLVAILAGGAVGWIQGIIMATTGISSVPLTLGSYILLSGLCHIVAGEAVLGYSNYEVGLWLDGIVLAVLSPRSLIVVAIFAGVWFAMNQTRFGPAIRATGADRRAARASGIPVARVVTGIFGVSGILCGLGGALFAYSTTAAKYYIGLDPFIFAVTAVLIGGVAMDGGRGTALGVLMGVLAMSALETFFLQLALPTYLVDLARGVLLLVVVLVEAPDLSRKLVAWRNRRLSQRIGSI
jgi:ribose/xylose/arabinose/galactoside ABC-type transport system permease subunit